MMRRISRLFHTMFHRHRRTYIAVEPSDAVVRIDIHRLRRDVRAPMSRNARSSSISMATVEPIEPSRRLRSAAAAEVDRLRRHLERLAGREAELRRELAAIHAAQQEAGRQLESLTHLAGGTLSAA